MHIPASITVGATLYKIIERDNAWREYAECDGQVRFDDLEIDIVTERANSEVANTVIHELGHVIWREYSLPKRPREERCVTVMGFGYTAIFSQNPDLLMYLEELIHG